MVAKSEQASLWTLYLTAYRLYQREVIEQKKLYKRFKDDFINGNTYPKRCDVDGLNEHNKNLGILRELLENRLDLIEKYFVRPSFEHKDYLAMQHELDTTEQKTNISFEYIKLIVMMNCERQFCQHRRNNLRLLLTRILIW